MSNKNWTHCPWCGAELVEESKDSPPHCSSCDFIHWNNPTPVVALLVETPRGMVLSRNHGWPGKMFGVPTGFVEKGEDPAETARRELKEELGVETAEISLFDVVGFAPMNQVLIGYHVKTDDPLVPGDDLAEIKLVPLERLKPKPFGTGILLTRFVERWRSSPPG